MDPNVHTPQNPSTPVPPYPPASDAPLPVVDLSPEALSLVAKQVKNEVTWLLTHPSEARDGLHLVVMACLLEAGVITKQNLRDQIVGPLDQYFRDRGYEADLEAERHETP